MVFIILGAGFEEVEAITPYDVLSRGGVSVCFVSASNEKLVAGAHGISIQADFIASDVHPAGRDAVVVPGGMGGVKSISASASACELIRSIDSENGIVAAICAGPSVLAGLGLIEGHNITCYPGCEAQMGSAVMVPGASAVTDGNVITGTSAGCAIPFALQLITALKGKEAADAVAQQIVIR